MKCMTKRGRGGGVAEGEEGTTRPGGEEECQMEEILHGIIVSKIGDKGENSEESMEER